MTSKYNRTGVLLLIVGTLIIVLTMATRRLSLLTNFGPKDWFQYFIAMVGFLGIGAGLFITSLSSRDNTSPDHLFSILMILGGLYVFVMGFVIVIKSRWLDLSIRGIGLIGAAFGFLYFFGVQKKFAFMRLNYSYMVKVLLLASMVSLLICFLLYWGAPIEFWQIINSLGLNDDNGGLLTNIHNFLMQFFTYS